MMKNVARKLLTIIALATATLASAQLNTSRIMLIGRNALYFEDYVLSIQYFNRVINVKPYLAEPYYYRAVAKFYLDDLAGSAGDCEIAIDINPFMVSAYNLHGIIMLRQNKSTDALEDFNRGLSLEGDDINLLMNRGIAHINLKNYDHAIADYDAILRFDKRNVAAILYRGIAMVQAGDTLTALSEFQRATELNKYSADAYTYLGMLNYQMRRYEDALSNYNRLAELRPVDANVYINRAITRYNLDDYQGCFDDIDEALRIDNKNILAYANRGMLRAEVGDYNNAIDDFSRVLALDPSNDIALFNRANLYLEVGTLGNALSDLDIIIARHPDFGPAYHQRSVVKRKLGDNKGAEVDYMTAYTFEQERVKRGLENAERAAAGDDNGQQNEKKKRESRSKNDKKMSKYDQLVVVADFGDNDEKLHQNNESIRGRVQHRDVVIDLEPVFELSFFTADTVLPKAKYYERSVEKFNASKIFDRPLIVTNRELNADGNQALQSFAMIKDVAERIEQSPNDYSLYMVRGTLQNLVMSYTNAINDFNVCVLKNSLDVNALFNRAATRFKMVEVQRSLDAEQALSEVSIGGKTSQQMQAEVSIIDYDLIMSDLQRVLEIDPEFEFAYYNMSLVQCLRKQYDAALQSLDKAIEINADFAEAYFNRGIIKIFLEQEKAGTDDLSKAGELGIVKAYNVIKRYTQNSDDDDD